MLCMRLIKAIYGCVKSALLWYKVFYSSLQAMGFVLNPYDSCVANCMIKGKQCMVAWYVDDAKISHEDPEVVTMIINKLEEQFGKMMVTWGSEHVFLGMNIRYTDEGTAVIGMKRYLQEAIDECGLDLRRAASSLGPGDLSLAMRSRAAGRQAHVGSVRYAPSVSFAGRGGGGCARANGATRPGAPASSCATTRACRRVAPYRVRRPPRCC